MGNYLIGYVAGYMTPGEQQYLIEEKVKRLPFGYKKAILVGESIVYPTKEEALKEARKLQKGKENGAGWRRFIRGMRYETSNPENSKGMLEWKEEYEKPEYID